MLRELVTPAAEAALFTDGHPIVLDGPGAEAELSDSTPDERLQAHGILLARLLRSPARTPQRWRALGFARQVDLVRAHLRPIRSHESLAHSYGREHFHIQATGSATLDARGLLRRSAIEVAYALRWLELADGDSRGPWLSIVAVP